MGSVTDYTKTKIDALLATLTTGLSGKLTAASNLSDLASATTARTNLGLGSAATTATTAYDAAGAATSAVAGIPSGAAAGTPSLRALGTTATTAAAGNDGRLSDTRTPTDGTVTLAKLAATGTRDTTTFYRGDGTFAAPPGGGAGGTTVTAVQNADGTYDLTIG